LSPECRSKIEHTVPHCCNDDIVAKCDNEAKKGKMLKCLEDNVDSLKPKCKKAVAEVQSHIDEVEKTHGSAIKAEQENPLFQLAEEFMNAQRTAAKEKPQQMTRVENNAPKETKPESGILKINEPGAHRCGSEHDMCECVGLVKYGSAGKNIWTDWKVIDGSIRCNNDEMGVDPAVGTWKECYCKDNEVYVTGANNGLTVEKPQVTAALSETASDSLSIFESTIAFEFTRNHMGALIVLCVVAVVMFLVSNRDGTRFIFNTVYGKQHSFSRAKYQQSNYGASL